MSKITYDVLAVAGLKEVLKQVGHTCQKLGIDFFIVGAIARNIWYASHRENIRGTKDIDFGVYVPTEVKYNQLRKILIEEYAYRASSVNAFCLINEEGKQIDLLPFGEIENEGRVMIDGKGLTTIRLDGFQESYESGRKDVEIEQEKYQVCTIPGIVILKLIAFDDRPDYRIKDAIDINSICKYYPDIESEFIWEHHLDLYDGEKEHNEVSMIALGIAMNRIIEKNPKLKNRIISILKKALNHKSPFLRYMIEDTENETLEMKANIIKHIKKGIEM